MLTTVAPQGEDASLREIKTFYRGEGVAGRDTEGWWHAGATWLYCHQQEVLLGCASGSPPLTNESTSWTNESTSWIYQREYFLDVLMGILLGCTSGSPSWTNKSTSWTNESTSWINESTSWIRQWDYFLDALTGVLLGCANGNPF